VTARLPVFYNCAKCPAFCCSYPQIPVTTSDELRLARGLGIPLDEVRRKVTKDGLEKGTRIMRHKDDAIFASVCRFLDSDTRRCTVYLHRPRACREYPGTARCGYYDFLCAERQRQEDPALVLTAWETDLG
jgi:Fe-S-cluster containining protein